MYHLTIPTLLDNYFEELQEFQEAEFKCTFGSDLLLRLRYDPLLILELTKNASHVKCPQEEAYQDGDAAKNSTRQKKVPIGERVTEKYPIHNTVIPRDTSALAYELFEIRALSSSEVPCFEIRDI
ncbi:hypothetical protein AVEN_147500-1 [Araneus ventricosus]|uniref:Uncharacterized protein n=1 Tax=Araneus ventricosus TaxID=182803 RepID=A0A4Y2JNY5_ARAVE|nr:hypothetical protein AVEN_147500-1 [Araneus ventricosus]